MKDAATLLKNQKFSSEKQQQIKILVIWSKV